MIDTLFAQIADDIVRLRRRRGLTQSQLAEKTGGVQAGISKIERMESIPTIKTLLKIAEALDARLVIRITNGDDDS